MSSKIKHNKGFTLIELLIVVVILGIILAVAVPAYSKYITDAKAAEAQQMLSAGITYVKSYMAAHNGELPLTFCDTTSMNGEWIDEIIADSGKYFDFYYGIEGSNPLGNDVCIFAVGRAEPFSHNDRLTTSIPLRLVLGRAQAVCNS